MTSKESTLVCILIMSSELQNCLNSHWSNPSYWLIIAIAYHQWCSRDRNLRDRDRDLVKISCRDRDSRLEIRDRDWDFKICAFCRNFVKNCRHPFWLQFFKIYGIFPTYLGCFLPANTKNKKSLNDRNFNQTFLCNIQSLETWNLPDRDQDRDTQKRVSRRISRPRRSLETPSLPTVCILFNIYHGYHDPTWP